MNFISLKLFFRNELVFKANCKSDYDGPGPQYLRVKPNITGSRRASDVNVIEAYFEQTVLDGIGENFPRLQKLSIYPKSLNTFAIERRYFSKMRNLKELTLGFSPIDVIAEDAFQDLKNLIDLDLESCKIEYFPEKLFWNMKKLIRLNINENPVKVLSPRAFQDVKNVEVLYPPQANNIEELVVKFPKLVEFYMNKHKMEKLEKSFFVNMIKVRKIGFSYSSIKEISEGAFQDLTRLEELSFDECGIEIIHEKSFWYLNKLTSLDLSYNAVKKIPVNAFRELTELNELLLKKCQITSLPVNVFFNLLKLDSLDLSSNPIKTLPSNIFKSLKSLTSLDVSDCMLEKLSSNLLANNLKLEEVDFSGNKLKVIEVDFLKFSQVRKLILSDNICLNAYFNEEDLPNTQSIAMPVDDIANAIKLNCTDVA